MSQSAPAVMMIRPQRFSVNPLTAATNAFQKNDIPDSETGNGIFEAARREFDDLARRLGQAGVQVCVFEDTLDPAKPDAVFPNNWITTHADGTVVMYPMMAVNRRTERRPELIKLLGEDFGFSVSTIIDFSPFETQDKILEGTGSMILDRVNEIVYACRSPRTHPAVLEEFCERFGYRAILFDSVDRQGMAIYHTNVMMTLGTAFAVVCLESVRDRTEQAELRDSLLSTGHEMVEISYQQMESFAGNMLELQGRDHLIVAMSQSARDSLNDKQVDALTRHAEIVSCPIHTLEYYGGGSVRCMLAEIYLPQVERDE
ncbi:MAG: arginine deiminase-related protein [Gammaproteobacteria bacterium]|nr:arginine deiminase-related protein [Gammaproteobacteria bacterium]